MPGGPRRARQSRGSFIRVQPGRGAPHAPVHRQPRRRARQRLDTSAQSHSGEKIMRHALMAALSAVSVLTGPEQAFAADLEWEVDNPFRYYKVDSSFALHEK